jgi:hypothetical protein
MKLTSMPDGKFIERTPADTWLTVGKEYEIKREIGINGVVIQANNGEDIIVCRNRFE